MYLFHLFFAISTCKDIELPLLFLSWSFYYTKSEYHRVTLKLNIENL